MLSFTFVFIDTFGAPLKVWGAFEDPWFLVAWGIYPLDPQPPRHSQAMPSSFDYDGMFFSFRKGESALLILPLRFLCRSLHVKFSSTAISKYLIHLTGFIRNPFMFTSNVPWRRLVCLLWPTAIYSVSPTLNCIVHSCIQDEKDRP